MMSGIRGKDTTPELVVRRFLHRHGLRYCLHRQDLPGRPDIVLPRHSTAVQIHGCFWHRHPGCRYAYTPKSNRPFWRKKFEENLARDRRTEAALRNGGWQVLIVWECEVTDGPTLRKLLRRVLRPRRLREESENRAKGSKQLSHTAK